MDADYDFERRRIQNGSDMTQRQEVRYADVQTHAPIKGRLGAKTVFAALASFHPRVRGYYAPAQSLKP
ncbi:hypothetical protein BIW11_06838 [Tropilaelaps mercedesae]|uniref:Uncharacterized protein n=1 Tax=Tropilaelaps mercedesae TaxID=418985 RepID=A0A1V9XWH2_9ACAR|nr:hypothetical protein BIW11_06838 [Tropilaelaps mercedesae]